MIGEQFSQLEYGIGIVVTLVIVADDLFFLSVGIVLSPFMGLKVGGNTGNGIFVLKKIDFAITVPIKCVPFDI